MLALLSSTGPHRRLLWRACLRTRLQPTVLHIVTGIAHIAVRADQQPLPWVPVARACGRRRCQAAAKADRAERVGAASLRPDLSDVDEAFQAEDASTRHGLGREYGQMVLGDALPTSPASHRTVRSWCRCWQQPVARANGLHPASLLKGYAGTGHRQRLKQLLLSVAGQSAFALSRFCASRLTFMLAAASCVRSTGCAGLKPSQ
jgi:hypothetical protein